MLVKLAYGRDGLNVNLPAHRTTVIEPRFVAGLAEEESAIVNSLREPIDSPSLRDLIETDCRVAISVCDMTRAIPTNRILPGLLGELSNVASENVTILVATGTHRGCRRDELSRMIGDSVLSKYRVLNHDCKDRHQLSCLGETNTGIPVLINRHFMDADVRITVGFVEPHFFAGFSGGPKMVAPGLAGLETIMALHSAELIRDPLSTWGEINGNPIHTAIREIAKMVGVDFAIDVTLNRDREITKVFSGEISAEHRAACRFAKETAMQPVQNRFDLVITTNSGYPLDLNLYQSVKGLSAAARIVRDGGTILCAAECSDGVPSEGEYGQLLCEAGSPEGLMKMISVPGFSRQDQWQAQIQAQIQLRAKVAIKSSGLTNQEIRAAHLEPVSDVECFVKERFGGEAQICVLPEGPQTIPYVVDGD